MIRRLLLLGLILCALSAGGAEAAVTWVTDGSASCTSCTSISTTFAANFFSGTCQALKFTYWSAAAGHTIDGTITYSVNSGGSFPRISGTRIPSSGTPNFDAGQVINAGIFNQSLVSGCNAAGCSLSITWTTNQNVFVLYELFNGVGGFQNGVEGDTDSSGTHFLSQTAPAISSAVGDMTTTSFQANNSTDSPTFTTNQTIRFGPTNNSIFSGSWTGSDSAAGSPSNTHTWTCSASCGSAPGNACCWGVDGMDAQAGTGPDPCTVSSSAGPGPGWLPNLGVGMYVPHSIWNALSRRLRHLPLIPNWRSF